MCNYETCRQLWIVVTSIYFQLLDISPPLLLASNTAVRVEALARLAAKVALGNKFIQQLDGGNQVGVNLALLSPAIDNVLHGIQTDKLYIQSATGREQNMYATGLVWGKNTHKST